MLLCVCVCVCVCMLNGIRVFETPWTVAQQGPLPTEFSRKEHWIRLPFPTPGALPDRGIKPCITWHLSHWQAGSFPL